MHRSYITDPNPVIGYEPGDVSVEIYDLSGKKVCTLYHGFKKGGTYQLKWDGKNGENNQVSSGVYFCKLEMATESKLFSQTRKLLFIK